MTISVHTHNLSKTYGNVRVVDELDLKIPTGSIYGFLGPNGSGKTTTMKMLLNLVQPTSGTIYINGRQMNRHSRRELLQDIGSLIENPPGYGHLSGGENMKIMQKMLNLPPENITAAIRTVRLEQQLDKKVRNYSLGMKQRLGIALALAKCPSLLILDEPTNGLDPAGIEEMRELLRQLANSGVTIVVSSHLLGEIDKVATHLGIIANGRLLFQGTRAELFHSAVPDVLLRCSDLKVANDLLRGDVVKHPGNTVRLKRYGDPETAQAVATLVGAGVDVYDVRREEQDLEDIFMNLTHQGTL